MPVDLPRITQKIERLRRWYRPILRDGVLLSSTDEQPLRAEIFNIEQLERHAKALAHSHKLAEDHAPDRLLARLEENERILVHTYDLITDAIKKERRIAPASEWLLDNFYIIEEQIRTARRHLPRSYSRELPRLHGGPGTGNPRVYAIALELIEHVDGGVDIASLGAFIAAYQTVQPLTLGELWAVPIMLRLALLENLRRVSIRLAVNRRDRDTANEWADRMVAVVEHSPSDLVIVLADMARADPPLSSAFLAELTRHMQGQGPHFAFAQTWLEHRLSEQGLQLQPLIQMESRIQAADQVSIGNSISSLRVLSSTDSRDFVEDQSLVEKTLWLDPPGIYADMDFATRDRYRHAVEQIARRSKLSENEIAQKAVDLAAANKSADRASHVGYYLIDKGRPALERAANMRLSPRIAIEKTIRIAPLFFYLTPIILLTAFFTLLILDFAFRSGVSRLGLALCSLPVILSVSRLSVALVNWIIPVGVSPKSLPRMDFHDGIASDSRTIVAVPAMLQNIEAIDELVDALEIHYLANNDDHLQFALLTDFPDAAEEVLPDDSHLLQHARERIQSLAKKYEHQRSDIFFLFHRPRKWNAPENVWMGHERKRGKLSDFNAVLLNGSTDRFAEIVGDVQSLKDIRYVITLDTDTQLPRDSARLMAGAMSHPLNRPVFDPRLGRVVEGYGILQPRVGVSLPSSSRSWFVRLFAADAGLDPYTRVVSNVYQDLFREGSFIGKGIYDVAAFERACANLPENTILSHDLLESAYARSGLLSDVELYEDHPSRYSSDVSRRRRWIRGDWQIIWWLFSRVPGLDEKWIANPISALKRWKIFDNLRRSLVPLALLIVLVLGWFVWPALATVTTLCVIVILTAVPIISTIADSIRKPTDLPVWMHLRASIAPLGRHLLQILLALIFLPYDAWISCKAIIKTFIRMFFTHRRLLEWQTSSEAERNGRTDLSGIFAAMWLQPAFAVILLTVAVRNPHHLAASVPILILWFFAPAIAWFISRPIPPRRAKLSPNQIIFLEKLARKTWRYFETFVSAEDNWLPPDNFQETPSPIIASRTSPTNIGMALLANLSAYDFGYSSAAQFLDRTNKTFLTMSRMDRFRSHFYNWYNTRTLKPLPPLYVSTVDSGNLTAHLLVLRQGILELIDHKIVPARVFEGIRDTLGVLIDAARSDDRPLKARRQLVIATSDLQKLEKIQAELRQPPLTLTALDLFFQRMVLLAADIVKIPSTDPEFRWWAAALERMVLDHRDDLAHIAPWIRIHSPSEKHELLEQLQNIPTLRQVAALQLSAASITDTELRTSVIEASARAAQRIRDLEDLAARAGEFADTDFSFLFNESRDLLTIGYRAADHRADPTYYDLLASEARLGSYVNIAQGQFGQEHWFALGRLLTASGAAPALLSWSGSMFEYLMPLLVMPTYENTLLDRTYKAVVQRQIRYGKQRGVPWGMSESGYNTTDQQLNYQYRAFGVPGMGLKRGLADDLVIAPYASVMALMIAPEAAVRNLQRLAGEGQQGAYGFYEAIDYTSSRLPPNTDSVTIRSFMAHHEGMSLLSLEYLLLNRPMQRRFGADPMLRAADLLLHERVPRAAAPIFPHATEAGTVRATTAEEQGAMRIYTDPNTPTPEIHLLSNGRYHVMVSSAGGGYSRWRDIAVTRWREDATRDSWGTFCYLRTADRTASEYFWSISHQPTLKTGRGYEAIFSQGKAEFRRRDEQIEAYTEISVSPEDDIEMRRITLTNRASESRLIEITTYAEVVLAPLSNDMAHPAFSNLFVQTELVRQRHAIICTRRPRSPGERPPWMVHLIAIEGTNVGETTFETDRLKFTGRNRSPIDPAAMDPGVTLSDSEGSVLDPIVCVRRTVRISAGESTRVNIVTGIAETREAAVALMEKYHDPRLSDRVFELAWTHSHVQLRQLNATETEAQIYGRLAGSVAYASSLRRANPSMLARNRRGQSGLWGYGISGDLPIVLVRIRDQVNIDVVRQAVQAHAYWRMRGFTVDLVIWNEDDSLYRQTLQDLIVGIFAAGPEAGMVDKPGGVFLRRGEQISEEDRVLLQAVARVVLFDNAGSFREQVERRGRSEFSIPVFRPSRIRTEPPIAVEIPRRDLAFFNGLGGFTQDGKEYITVLMPGKNTPAPWCNVIANPQFGTVVSESGSVYTWSENSHEFRITPWHNDPISGIGGEALYIRDDETGKFWSPSPLPARGAMPYVIRHGFGYTIFEYEEDGIFSELILYVATAAPVKFARFKIINRSGRPRRLSVTGYWELVLGELRPKTLMHVVTEIDPVSNAVFARNFYNTDFPNRVVFADSSEFSRMITADRTEFLGRNGTPANPSALRRTRLSGRVGAGLDPCIAMQVQLPLLDGQQKEFSFILGSGESEEQARQLVQRHRGFGSAQRELEAVWHYWSRALGTLYIETPDPSVNFLANGWLLYQTLACRMWARTGFYQSGGAFGFRDQLQDAMALLHAEPQVFREHLLRAAAHQFREGDVQHWWHPPQGRGVRTHFSDDYLWLPYAVSRYVTATGDTGVLSERLPFLESRPLRPEEESVYDLPHITDDVGTVYSHCIRAINYGLRFGEHGLPLMGCGDWNDGMNLVGEHGKGESVWLAFFLHDVLTRFAVHARQQGDTLFAEKCINEATTLVARIEANAWDGEWYRRAYFDNGEPLGSAQSPECQIDSLPQTWAVLTNAGEPARAKLAMSHVDQRLVRRPSQLIQLFDPPFDKSNLEPGYIKGYVPGVRENGGQYTHAAVWTVMAFAALGDPQRAWETFTMINPIHHGTTPQQIETYKVEPYVIAADVYAVAPHVGRGGWTWYTGSAGWAYRLITESLLGLYLEVDKLRFAPCLPSDWKSFKVHYRYRETFYHITIQNSGGGKTVKLLRADGVEQPDKLVHLADDRIEHNIEVELE